MSSLFKSIMYFGVLMSLAGFAYPYVQTEPAIANLDLPTETKNVLAFGGLGLIVLGLIGRSFTRKPETVEWK